VASALAAEIARALTEQPALVLGLPTGRTPIPLYAELVSLHRAGRADFSQASTFNLDEFLGLSAHDEGRYYAFMREHLFDHVNLAKTRIHFLNGATADPERECARYEHTIERAGGIDLQILGLGANGHIGFNEPADSLVARTHRTRLRQATRRANSSRFGNRPSAVPREALSMGVATILAARRIILMATGSGKAACVERMIRGPLTTRVPASFLQVHGSAEAWLDRAAASRLSTTLSVAPRRPRRLRP
jgi:glucosamine-6-phosphate deaminase